MIDVRKLSDATLKELHEIMDTRRKSCVQNPDEEAEYQTQSEDWQRMFTAIKDEMKRRGFI